jgi:putative tryptophan/tyrosine transport system substrate-binding protein
MTFIVVPLRSSNEFYSVFAGIMREHPDGLLITADPVQQLHIGQIIDFLATNRLPAMFQVRENVLAGGLMSYGASVPALFRDGARYVHRILQGSKPADLPVEQPTKFELVISCP